jgi:hypothetical protein
LRDKIKDGVQLALQMQNVLVGDSDTRQTRDPLYRGGIDRHEIL